MSCGGGQLFIIPKDQKSYIEITFIGQTLFQILEVEKLSEISVFL